MRSGQYKISSRKNLGSDSDSKRGFFFRSTHDLPVLSSISSKYEESLYRVKHHRSCENVRDCKLSTMTWEQQYGSGSKGELLQSPNEVPGSAWQAGRIITVPKNNRIRTAISHSSLHTLSNPETTLCSASSGYSSSNSSSYGSFKSSISASSRNRSQSPELTKTLSHIDNPLYDVSPVVTLKSIADATPIYDIPPLDEPQIDHHLDHHPDLLDPIAKKCKDYFERRTKPSYRTCGNVCGNAHKIHDTANPTSRKSPLDTKIQFLRNEIACLMKQDDNLFKQLLALHDSISTIKAHNALEHTHGIPHPVYDLNEELEEENENVEDQPTTFQLGHHRVNTTGSNDSFSQRNSNKKAFPEEDEDEGHCTDLSLDNTSSLSPSPSSTISSQSSKSSSQRMGILGCRVYDLPLETEGTFTRSRKSYAPTARNRTRSASVHQPKPPVSNMRYGGTTALVIVHTDDENLFLKDTLSKPLQRYDTHTSNVISKLHNTCTTSFTSPAKTQEKKLAKKSKSLSKVSCSSHTVVTPQNMNHSRYREALIM